ncbi:heme/hemin ABC transporter substrate-binding protein [Agromyces seonyuensis]|uniref:ABC transporter substrate-binding protein n=1 Tax=Agromyces seonyuensis TaxID=2662446 RepID=A0A6I4NS33_9MICO|nr:ABC transporter substrate-binding protein [Agromyces seonyuensis]MWB97288.1 ABC transporter substrate-binding protein [Agromyces seonyuensis]
MSSRFRRSVLSIAAIAAAAALAGCAAAVPTGTGVRADAAVSREAECAGSQTPFAELAFAADPKAFEGPSTACLEDTSLPVVDSDESPALPATVIDVDGHEVEIASIERILPLDITGSIAATVFSLGLGEHVVGRDSSTGFPEAADLPEVTQGGHSLSAETILSLDPTVVITDTTLGPRDVLEQLRDAGIPLVIVTKERSVELIDDLVVQVADALGVPGRGAQLVAETQNRLDAVSAAIDDAIPADAADRPRMLFLYVRGTANVYYLFGEESGADSLIDAVGGVDVAEEIGWTGMKPITAEALVQAAPDLVLVMTHGLESTGGVDGLLDRVPALAATPAGEHRRIVDMADSEVLSFGPRAPEIIEALARAIYAPADSGPLQ